MRIGGIKYSGELVQFTFHDGPETAPGALGFFKCLAENRINMPFVSMGTGTGRIVSICCVAIEDGRRAEQLAAAAPAAGAPAVRMQPVGALTLFPHRSDLALAGLVIRRLAENNIPIYAVASSISALTVTTDFRLMDRATSALDEWIELPPNHAPFRPQFRVRQIVS